MSVLLVYLANDGFGMRIVETRDGEFVHNPPTVNDVREMEEAIRKKCGYEKVVIINWLPIGV